MLTQLNHYYGDLISYLVWDGWYSHLVMTNGECIMMWSQEYGWLKQSKNSFMLVGDNGKKYRIGVNSSGSLTTVDVTNETIYV